jgi:hypothetical protein
VPVAHTCNPSFRRQRSEGSAWGKNSARPYIKKPFTKIGLVAWLKVKALSSSLHLELKGDILQKNKVPNLIIKII